MTTSDRQDLVFLMRAWVGLLAAAVTIAAITRILVPDFFLSDEPADFAGTPGLLWNVLNIALVAYALALWVATLRIDLGKLRLVVLFVLLSALVGWAGITFLSLRVGTIEVVGPVVMLLLVFGVPSVLAILLETRFRRPGETGGGHRGAT